MEATAFEARVAELSRLSEREPARYRRGVIGWTVLGYVALGGFLIGALALLGTLGVLGLALLWSMRLLAVKFFLKGGFLLAVPAWLLVRTLLRALRVEVPPPAGRPVQPDEYPVLFTLIDEVRQPLGVPRPAHVLLTEDLNAAVAEVPRVGVLPWFSTYLVLGLPLMQAVSPAELKSILAHELGHLSQADGQLGSWIYRVRGGWFRVARALEVQPVGGARLLQRFFGWYLPRFSAWTFVLSRAQEYAADRASVRITDARTAADALSRSQLAGRALEEVVTALQAEVKEDATPPGDFYQRLARRLRTPAQPVELQRWLDEAAAEPTDVADTHPSLSDRLSALGESLRVPPALETTAAEAVFGEGLPALLVELSGVWQREMARPWQERFGQTQEQRARLAELEDRETLGEDELLLWAKLVESLREESEAVMAWSRVVGRLPEEPEAAFHLGRIKLSLGLDEGLALLRRACLLDEDAVLPAAQLATRFLVDRDRPAELAEWQERFSTRVQQLQVLEQARSELSLDTPLSAHDLGGSTLAYVLDVLQHSDGVVAAWLWRKDVPGEPVYVLVVQAIAGAEATRDEAVGWVAAGFEVPDEDVDFQIIGLHQLERSLRTRLSAEAAQLPV